MNERQSLHEEFKGYTSEHLLSLRARADGLSDEAHELIEQVMRDRGEIPPPRPSRPVDIATERESSGGMAGTWIVVVVLFLGGQVLIQVFKANQAIGIPVALACLAYAWWQWNRKKRPTTHEQARDAAQARIGTGGYSELMFAAADADLNRSRELLNYGAAVNAQDDKGASALHYAARGGHLEIVRLLVERGANPHLKTNAGKTAIELAEAGGHLGVISALKGMSK